MFRTRHLGSLVELLVVAVVLALLAGHLLGQPVVLGYVETGSMRPTLSPGDGFIAVPSALTTVEEGDIVVFRPELLSGGKLTTHRVVEVTPGGYVTQGDANTRPDQAGDEPPVRDVQVVAEVVQIDGRAAVVPHLGTLVTALRDALGGLRTALAVATGGLLVVSARDLALALGGAGAVAYAASSLSTDRRARLRRRAGATVDQRSVVLALAALVVVATTAAMILPAGVTTFDVVSADVDAPGPRVVVHGTSETTTYTVASGGYLPVVAFLSSGSPNLAVDPGEVSVPPGATVNATVTLSAPRKNGYYREYLVEDRYLAVLPASVLRALHSVHPWLALLAVDAVVAGGFLVAALLLLGPTTRARQRPRGRRPLARRLPPPLRRFVGRGRP